MKHSWLPEVIEELARINGKLLLAVSGGADSVALLRLAHAAGVDAEVATLNHRLRPEALDEVEFVRQLAESLGVPFHTATFDTRAVATAKGWNLEEAARRLRYQHLAEIARRTGASHIATGHTRDDQVETVFMQLLRGAAWLTGMPAVRGKIVRPLLGTSRQELTDWLEEIGQNWTEDATNQDVSFERAWLRHAVLPGLRARHPDLDERIRSMARFQQQLKDYISERASRYRRPSGELDADRLRHRHAALRNQAVADLLEEARVPRDASRLGRIDRKMVAGENYRETVTPKRTLRLVNGLLDVVTADQAAPGPSQPVTEASQLPEGVPESVLALRDLKLRTRLPGDRIRMQGGTRKVSDVLIDAKVPREQRDSIRLLASGSQVLWIDGIAAAADSGLEREPDDRQHMYRALTLAQEAAQHGELPVGAVVVRAGGIIASARNETEATGDPTAHAELLAIRRAAEVLGDWRLTGCTLYVTLEPCAMCFGAMLQAHLPEVVYAAPNPREGAAGGVADLDLLGWKRKVTVRRGPLAKESAAILTAFFAERR